MRRAFLLSLGLATAGACLPTALLAQPAFPSRPITIVVPTPPAGPLDLFARALSLEFGKRWKVPVVVENKPGAGTAVGTQFVARAKPDGHTMLVTNITITAYAALNKASDFDVEKDFQPLTLIGTTPYFLIVPAKGKAKNVEELFAEGRANPGKLNFAIIPNSQQQIDTVRVLRAAGIEAALIPYAGAAPITQALLAHEVDAYLGTLAGLQSHFESGKLIPVAATSAAPSSFLPAVPTLKSKGFDLDIVPWYAMFVPAGVSADVAAELRRGILEAVKSADFEVKAKAAGYDVHTSTSAELAQLISANVKTAREIVRTANIQPQ
jgi:tripartite-type tricarboxylate transporter receptor subunit TctC